MVVINNVINELYNVIEERKIGKNEGSYTSYLFSKGKEKILKKVGEECTELVIASMKEDNRKEQIYEMCDLIYHLLVLSSELNISTDEIKLELESRQNKINNFKGERKTIENI